MIVPASFIFLYKFVVICIYGTTLIISTLFTFSIDTYNQLDELLDFTFLPPRVMNPLERNINFFDDWLAAHNRAIGFMLILLSMLNMIVLLEML